VAQGTAEPRKERTGNPNELTLLEIENHKYNVDDLSSTSHSSPAPSMSYIWEKSSTWRWIVRGTRGSPLAMTVFTGVTMFAVPIGVGTLVMHGTNPETEMDEAKIAKLRRDAGLDTKIMVRAT